MNRLATGRVSIMMSTNDFDKKQVIFVFLNQGEKLSFSNDNLIVKSSEGKIKHQSTCYRIFALFLVGHFTMTSGILQRSRKFGFPIILMTHGFRIYDVIGSQMEGNTLLRSKQYSFSDLNLARHFIINKLRNQRWVLNQQRGKTNEVKKAIEDIDGYICSLADYNGDLYGLLGVEGSAARSYFKNHFNNINWNGRKPRIKSDYVNSTLDIGYTLLFSMIEAMLRLYGFDLFQGVLHRQFYMRKSLVCDLMEPIRPLVDEKVKKAINLKQCKEEDFTAVNKRYLLKWEKNTEYVSFLLEPILEKKHDIFTYVQSYYRKFMKDSKPEDFPVFEMS